MTRDRFPELLLADQYAPITVEVGLLRSDYSAVVEAFVAWRQGFEWAKRAGLAHSVNTIRGDLGLVLPQLLPLLDVSRDRFLFVPTNSEWTAVFDNGKWGPDVGSAVTVLAHQLGCLGLRAVADPPEISGRPRQPVSHGAFMLDLYDPTIEPELWPPARGLAAVREYDDRTWIWREVGTPQPFEQPVHPKDNGAQLTLPLLRQYLASFNVNLFDEEWYVPRKVATLVVEERHGPNPPIPHYLSLIEVQKLMHRPDRATRAIGY